MERRDFIKCAICGGCALAIMEASGGLHFIGDVCAEGESKDNRDLRECMFYKKLDQLQIGRAHV